MNNRDKITMIITVTVCIFILFSLVGAYALAWTGKDTGVVWPRMFDLVQVLSGGVVGYVAGQHSVRDK